MISLGYDETLKAMLVAFNAANLESIALALRTKYPLFNMIPSVVDDQRNTGNPGLTKAKAAGQAADGAGTIPVYKETPT